MAMSIATSMNGLIGRCACCDNHIAGSRRSMQVQKFPSSCSPAPLSNSKHSFLRSSKGAPRSALEESDFEARDNSPKKAEEGPNARPIPGYKKPQRPQSGQSALARALAYKQAKESGQLSEKAKLDKAPEPERSERPRNVPEVEIFRGQSFSSRLQSASDSSSAAPSTSGDTSPKAGSDAIPSKVKNGSDPIPAPSTSGGTSGKAGIEASPTEAENVSQGKPEGLSTSPSVDYGKSIGEKIESVPDSEASVVEAQQPAATSTSTSPDAGKKSTVSLDAFTKAQAHKQQQAEMIAALKGEKPTGSEPAAKSSTSTSTISNSSSSSSSTSSGSKENFVEVEIVTRDGVIKKLVSPEKAFTNVKEFRRTSGVSSIDFSGLGFADKKQGGRKVVREDYQPPPPGALPEVEILTKDSNSGTVDSEEGDLYKPRVSTWGVFPRPADISKSYGGGRTIRPGDTLETEEERIAREAKTQKLLADYKKKMGLDVDPRLQAECQKIMKQGDSLMDSGDLKGALALFETVMEKMTFQSELHGLAALQGAICLDSLARFTEAKDIYEKLISHPNGKIRKQAKQLLYGFRAMENLKVSTSNKWDTSVYAKYFEAFADGYNTTYKASDDEKTNENMEQYLAYALLLFFPILLVFVLSLSKGSSS